MVITLPRQGATLELSTDAAGWCTVTLLEAGQRLALGAESKGTVCARLAAAVGEAPLPPAGPGGEPAWMLSLAEQHASIYAADLDGDRVLSVQDANARTVARLALTASERCAWRKELATL